MARRKKLKAAVQQETQIGPKIHDRKATDLPRNARVAITTEKDPFGYPKGASFDAKRNEWMVPDPESAEMIVSLRDDPLRQMLVRRQITRELFDGGRWYQERYEGSQIGAVKAMDPAKEAVDGGGLPETLTEWVQRAMSELLTAHRMLGLEGESLCRGILGRGMTIIELCLSRGMCSRIEVEYAGRRFRECLNTLSKLAGCS